MLGLAHMLKAEASRTTRSWWSSARADAATFNELNGWSPAQFGRLAASWGLPHAALLETTTGYHVGVASRHPIAVEEANVSAPFHHGVLVVRRAPSKPPTTRIRPRARYRH